MIDLEEQLAAGMRERVVGLALTTDVVGEATRRHRGRVAVQRIGYAVGVVGLAAAIAAGVTIGDPGTGSPPTTPALAAPELRLASAIAATEKISYQVKVTELRGSEAEPSITEGAFDPATKSGYLQSRWTGAEESVYYERLVDGVLYISSAGSQDNWKQETGTHDRLRYESTARGAVSQAVGASADPEVLFDTLRESGAKITEKGAGIYHFELALEPEVSPRGRLKQSIAGDVTVNADNRIAKIAYARTAEVSKDGHTEPPSVVDVVVALSAYGAPVNVEKPTDVVVVTR